VGAWPVHDLGSVSSARFAAIRANCAACRWRSNSDIQRAELLGEFAMKAVMTRFIPASNVRGARIKASAEGVKSLTISYPHEMNAEQGHRLAAEKLATRQGWKGDFCGGMLPGGDWAFTFSETKEARKNPKSRKPLESRAAYINRRSQITKRPPSKRLRTRRKMMTLMRERGFEGAFPNPNSHDVWVQIQRSGKWHDVDGYSEPVARAVAEIFGKAGYTARVIRK